MKEIMCRTCVRVGTRTMVSTTSLGEAVALLNRHKSLRWLLTVSFLTLDQHTARKTAQSLKVHDLAASNHWKCYRALVTGSLVNVVFCPKAPLWEMSNVLRWSKAHLSPCMLKDTTASTTRSWHHPLFASKAGMKPTRWVGSSDISDSVSLQRGPSLSSCCPSGLISWILGLRMGLATLVTLSTNQLHARTTKHSTRLKRGFAALVSALAAERSLAKARRDCMALCSCVVVKGKEGSVEACTHIVIVHNLCQWRLYSTRLGLNQCTL